MGSGSSFEERQIDKILKSNNLNIKDIAAKLPKNKEIRVKKIYHVNRQEQESDPVPVMPEKVVKVIQPTILHPPIVPAAVEYRPRVLVKDPNASSILLHKFK